MINLIEMLKIEKGNIAETMMTKIGFDQPK